MRGSRVGGFLLAVALALTALAVFGTEERLTATGVPASPSTGCASGRQPNLVGTVTDPFGNPFPTEVSIRLSAETTGNPYGWGPVNPGLSASTDVFGRYAMCIDVNSLRHDDKLGTLHGLQVIAKTTSEMWQELGDSPSAFVSIDTCAQRCTLDVTMTSPVVKGTIAEGDSLRVAANGIYLADVDISMDGTFSLVLNPPGRFPEGFGVGVGITLTAASDVLFIEQGWNPADMDQAADRCHRIGQKDSVTVYTMLCEGTIDERIAKLIDEKRTIVNAVMEGKEVDSFGGISMAVLEQYAVEGMSGSAA